VVIVGLAKEESDWQKQVVINWFVRGECRIALQHEWSG
jgi:hypothetical protein